ncbi:MAG: hypothetical protein GVY36_08520 [Verrucomicrobia bacterium]|jgi:hypothetical protein|nr:hypothetical protein [Verrucomicrobiota bacterium]
MAAFAEPFEQTLGAMLRGFSFAAVALPESDDVVLFYALQVTTTPWD